MRDPDLFQLALCIQPPWRVDRSNFDPAAKRLGIHIDFQPGGTFPCPDCGQADRKASHQQRRHLAGG